jgi:hypothetical protein
MMVSFLGAILILLAGGSAIAAETPTAYLHCAGYSNLYGKADHTISLYTKTTDVDGFPYSLEASSNRYVMLAPNPYATILPNAAALILIQINRVTGDYEISAGVNNHIQAEHGHCTKQSRML